MMQQQLQSQNKFVYMKEVVCRLVSPRRDKSITDGPTDGPTDRRTNRRTHPLIESWLTTKNCIFRNYLILSILKLIKVGKLINWSITD